VDETFGDGYGGEDDDGDTQDVKMMLNRRTVTALRGCSYYMAAAVVRGHARAQNAS